MNRLLRFVSALAVLFESAVFLLAVNYAAHRVHFHRPSYVIVLGVMLLIGLFSLVGVYFVLVPAKY
jgi:hypothetical protein